jgi:hypothetical protein
MQNYINHIALVLDASGSMSHLTDQVVKVADNQIAYLAQRSKELDQETRVTIYTFDYPHRIKCIAYDKDVLRLPTLKGLYRPDGQTALIDATLKALDDLAKTPELYGEHAFLTYVLTDGAENNSHNGPATLEKRLKALPDHWTLACFVPNVNGVHEAKKFGFAKDNIAVWDTTAQGVKEVGETIRRATETFMTGRATGTRGYKNLFNLDTSKLTKANVTNLPKLGPGQFRMFPVEQEGRIDEFVETKTKRAYVLGEAFYQLTKPVDVQPTKKVALYERKGHSVYIGKEARTLLGMPDSHTVKVSPAATPDFDIFIQSTSVNRKLFPGTHVLLVS